MRAFILGAGQGTRLRPLTDDRPKCLVEVAGRSLLAWQHRALAVAGVEDVTVIGGYRAEAIEAAGYRLLRNEQYASSNMVHSIYLALTATPPGEAALIVYGDIAFEPRLIEALVGTSVDVATVVDSTWHAYWRLRFGGALRNDLESLVLAPDHRVVRLGEETDDLSQVDARYVGLSLVTADAVEQVKRAIEAGGVPSHLSTTELLQRRIDDGRRVFAVPVQHGWFEVDSVADLELIERLHAAGTLAPICDLGVLA